MRPPAMNCIDIGMLSGAYGMLYEAAISTCGSCKRVGVTGVHICRLSLFSDHGSKDMVSGH